MSFSIYLGPFQPFLEEQLSQTFRAYREKNPFEKVTVLVPNLLLVGYLRKTLMEKGLSLFNLEIHTLSHYLDAFTQEKVMVEGLKSLPDVLVPLVLKEISRSLFTPHSTFASVKDMPGFYSSLRATLGELKEGLYSAASLKTDSAHFIRFKEERLGRKLKEFSGVLEAYENWKIKNHWLDREDRYLKVLEIPVVSQEPIWVYGFYDAPELQKKVLQHLSSQESHWFIPYEAGHPAFVYAESFVQWAQSWGKVCAQGVWKENEKTPLQRLQGSLFLHPERTVAQEKDSFETSDCKILLCPGESREATEVGRFLLGEVQRQDVFFSDCAVVFREGETYRKMMPSAWKAQGIPLLRSLPSPLLEFIESKILLLLLDCFLKDFSRADLINLLSCPQLNPVGLGLTLEEWNPSYWDVLSREARIVEGEKEWTNRLALWRQNKEKRNAEEEETPSAKDEIKTARSFEKVLVKLFETHRRFTRSNSWKAKAVVLQEILRQFLYPSEGLEEVEEVLQSFILLSESFTLTLLPEDFRSLIVAMLDEKKTTPHSLEPGGVQMVDLMQSRGVSFEVTVLPGLVEKSFPRLVRPDPLFLDEERNLLNGRSPNAFIPLKQSGALEEKLLFTLAVRSARKALILTAPILKASSGSPRTPSTYLFESVEAILGKRMSRLEEASSLVKVVLLSDWVKEDITQCVNSLEILLTVLSQARKGQPTHALALVSDQSFYFEGCDLLKNRQAQVVFTPYEGLLLGEESQRRLKKGYSLEGMGLSASRLETYATCPLRYFYRYILHLKVYPEPEEILQLPASDRGNLMHRILEKTIRQGVREGWIGTKEKDRGLQVLHQESMEAFKRFEQEGVSGAPGLWQWEKEQMLEDLRMVLEKVLSDTDWTPLDFEVDFGEKASLVDFKLEDQQTFQLQGRMDRIDISNDGRSLKVVDYKTGTATGFKNNSVQKGTKLQLPFYLWALKKLYPDKDAHQAFYDFITRRGNYKESRFDLEHVGSLEAILGPLFSTLSQAVQTGLFPGVGRACEHCDYHKLCGTGMKSRGERKKDDPRVQRYYQLGELP